MKTILLIVLSFILGVTGTIFSASFAQAAYPEKPVTLICVWGTGGANDAIARNIAELMKKHFPQPVVVVNRAGGSGSVGTAEVVSAKPDGYTIGSTTMPPLTILPHQMKLPYKTPDDYTPIALVSTQNTTFSVLSDSPFKTLKDFVAYAKANPGKLLVSTGGVGHYTDLILEQLRFQAKIDVSDTASKGGGEQIALLLGKHADAVVLTVFEVLPHVQAGKVRVLAVIDEKRSPLLPDVPIFSELGYDITITSYTVLMGPKGLSSDVVSKIQEAFKKVSQDPNFVKLMAGNGSTVVYEGTEDLRKRLWKDYNANKGIFERLGGKKN